MVIIYNTILTFIKPLLVFLGRLHFPFTHKRVTGVEYYQIRDSISIGTVLLTSTHGELSNLINPEKIKHAGIYVGDLGDGIRYVIEALGRGVVKTDLVTFLTTKDVVVGCRPRYLTNEDRALLPSEARKVLGVPYDYLFNKSSRALYCFEAAAYILKMVRPEIRLKCKTILKGKEIFSYETFLNDTENFNVVFDTRTV